MENKNHPADPEAALKELRSRYEAALIRGDSRQAQNVIQDALYQQHPPQRLLLGVLWTTVQHLRRRVRNEGLNPLLETYAVDLSLEQTHVLRVARPHRIDRATRVLVLAMDEGRARFEGYLAADLLRFEGYDVDYITGKVPPASLSAFAQHRAVGLIVMLPSEPVDESALRHLLPLAEAGAPVYLTVGYGQRMSLDIPEANWHSCPDLAGLCVITREAMGWRIDDKASYLQAMGHRVRQWRRQRGWTREALAQQVGESEAVINQLEEGQFNPPLFSLQQIGQALGVRLTVLLDL